PRKKLANRKKKPSKPAARKRNRRKRRRRPEHRVLPCAPSGHFVRFSLSVVGGVQLAGRTDWSLCVVRRRIFYRLSSSLYLPRTLTAANTLAIQHSGSIF